MGKVLNMTFASSLTNLCEVNSSFDTGVLRICYTGKNRNGSFISKEAISNSLDSIYNCPIVCNYDRDSDTLGGHDMELVRDNDGGLRIVNMTQPVGVIPESANVWFADYKDDDGIVHEYLYADVLIWKRQEAYKKIKEDGISAHSMEITVKDSESVDGVLHINNFEFTAFALIGCAPCFESSALEIFSKKDFKQQLSEMMLDLKETFSKVTTSSEDDDTHPKILTEGGEEVLDEKMELMTKYGIDADTLDFSIEDFTVEELEEKFKVIMGNTAASGEPTDDGEESKLSDDGTEDFTLISNFTEEIAHALESEKIQTEYGMRSHYCYVDCYLDAKEVYAWDTCDWLLYGFTYQEDGNRIVINFDSKKRKKYMITDFDEGTQESPFAFTYKEMQKRIQEASAFEEKYQAASNTIASMENELKELRTFKENTEAAVAEEKCEELFARFEDLNGIEAFEALKEKCLEFDLDTLEEKCYAIRGRNGSTAKFSLETKVPKLKVEKTDKSDEPYGGLFQEYASSSN